MGLPERLFSFFESFVTASAFGKLLTKIATALFDDAIRSVETQFDVTIPEERVATARNVLLETVGTRIRGINEGTRQAVAIAVRDGLANGESIAQVAARIEGLPAFSPKRAELVARTETAYWYNLAAIQGYRATGLVDDVFVMDGVDDDDECRAANGQTWSLDFAESHLLAHPNCRRAFAPVLRPASKFFANPTPTPPPLKFNPYHDELGKFSTGSGAGSAAPKRRIPKPGDTGLPHMKEGEQVSMIGPSGDVYVIANNGFVRALPKRSAAADVPTDPNLLTAIKEGLVPNTAEYQALTNARPMIQFKEMADEADAIANIDPSSPQSWNSDAETAKVAVMKRLAVRLKGNTDFTHLAEHIGELAAPGHVGSTIQETAVSTLVQQWSWTSWDSNALSIAIQRAAAHVFGQPAPSTTNVDLNTTVMKLEAWYGEGLKAFVKAQYDESQEQLAKHGITELTVVRGLSFGESEEGNEDHYLSGNPSDLPTVRYLSDTSGPPLSSWSTNPETASGFANNLSRGAMAVARVPASEVVGTPFTGVGCLGESEIVLKSGTTPAFVFLAPKHNGLYHFLSMYEGIDPEKDAPSGQQVMEGIEPEWEPEPEAGALPPKGFAYSTMTYVDPQSSALSPVEQAKVDQKLLLSQVVPIGWFYPGPALTNPAPALTLTPLFQNQSIAQTAVDDFYGVDGIVLATNVAIKKPIGDDELLNIAHYEMGWTEDEAHAANKTPYAFYTPADYLHIPDVRDEVMSRGYDGYQGMMDWDGKQVKVAIPFTKSQLAPPTQLDGSPSPSDLPHYDPTFDYSEGAPPPSAPSASMSIYVSPDVHTGLKELSLPSEVTYKMWSHGWHAILNQMKNAAGVKNFDDDVMHATAPAIVSMSLQKSSDMQYFAESFGIKGSSPEHTLVRAVARLQQETGRDTPMGTAVALGLHYAFGGPNPLDFTLPDTVATTLSGAEIYATHKDAIDDFVKTQYAVTQDHLNGSGTSTFLLMHGHSFDDETDTHVGVGTLNAVQPGFIWTMAPHVAENDAWDKDAETPKSGMLRLALVPNASIFMVPTSGSDPSRLEVMTTGVGKDIPFLFYAADRPIYPVAMYKKVEESAAPSATKALGTGDEKGNPHHNRLGQFAAHDESKVEHGQPSPTPTWRSAPPPPGQGSQPAEEGQPQSIAGSQVEPVVHSIIERSLPTPIGESTGPDEADVVELGGIRTSGDVQAAIKNGLVPTADEYASMAEHWEFNNQHSALWGDFSDVLSSDEVDYNERENAIKVAVRRVAKPLKDSAAFGAFAKTLASESSGQFGSFTGDPTEHAVDALLNQWFISSWDSNPLSISVQRAAATFFGQDVPDVDDPKLQRKIDAIESTHGDALVAFVESMYNETQKQLADAGITEMYVARGLSFPDALIDPANPKSLDQLEETQLRFISDTSGPPLSSWTTSPKEAMQFAAGLKNGALIVAKVPAADIVSTGTSGLGSFGQLEVVVRSGTAPALMLINRDKGGPGIDYKNLYDGIGGTHLETPDEVGDHIETQLKAFRATPPTAKQIDELRTYISESRTRFTHQQDLVRTENPDDPDIVDTSYLDDYDQELDDLVADGGEAPPAEVAIEEQGAKEPRDPQHVQRLKPEEVPLAWTRLEKLRAQDQTDPNVQRSITLLENLLRKGGYPLRQDAVPPTGAAKKPKPLPKEDEAWMPHRIIQARLASAPIPSDILAQYPGYANIQPINTGTWNEGVTKSGVPFYSREDISYSDRRGAQTPVPSLALTNPITVSELDDVIEEEGISLGGLSTFDALRMYSSDLPTLLNNTALTHALTDRGFDSIFVINDGNHVLLPIGRPLQKPVKAVGEVVGEKGNPHHDRLGHFAAHDESKVSRVVPTPSTRPERSRPAPSGGQGPPGVSPVRRRKKVSAPPSLPAATPKAPRPPGHAVPIGLAPKSAKPTPKYEGKDWGGHDLKEFPLDVRPGDFDLPGMNPGEVVQRVDQPEGAISVGKLRPDNRNPLYASPTRKLGFTGSSVDLPPPGTRIPGGKDWMGIDMTTYPTDAKPGDTNLPGMEKGTWVGHVTKDGLIFITRDGGATRLLAGLGDVVEEPIIREVPKQKLPPPEKRKGPPQPPRLSSRLNRIRNASGVEAFATTNNLDPLAYESQINENAKRELAQRDVIVLAPIETILDEILPDEKIMNQFESDSSNGLFDPSVRLDAEESMFGIEDGIAYPDAHPIYGYMGRDSEPIKGSGWEQYGDVKIVLKPHVRKHTTFAAGDSLGGGELGQVVPAPIAAPHIGAWGDSYEDGMSPWGSYAQLEAQIHQPVTIKDIAKFVMYRDDVDPALIEQLELAARDKGIEVDVREWTKNE
jgi:hypothetical protein